MEGLPISSVLLALVLAVIGGTWKIASKLTRLEDLIDSRLSQLENGVMMLEDDVSNLWAAVRSGEQGPKLLDATRRPRFRPYEPKKPL